MANERGLVFVHIPKTGGTTLRTIVDRQYPRRAMFWSDGPQDVARLVALPEEARRRLLVVQGHVQYGVHEHLFVPVDYITMLRRPVELVTSLYYFIRRRWPERIREQTKDLSLAEFAARPFYMVRNLQTRAISGMEQVDEAALERAKANLRSGMVAFGLTERFDESVLYFSQVLGWRNTFYRVRNVTRRPRRDVASEEAAAIIAAHNTLDRELYAFATRIFEERIARQAPEFQDELRAFRRANPVRGRLTDAYRRVRWGIPRRIGRLLGRASR
jgi:hypothetical protein